MGTESSFSIANKDCFQKPLVFFRTRGFFFFPVRRLLVPEALSLSFVIIEHSTPNDMNILALSRPFRDCNFPAGFIY